MECSKTSLGLFLRWLQAVSSQSHRGLGGPAECSLHCISLSIAVVL